MAQETSIFLSASAKNITDASYQKTETYPRDKSPDFIVYHGELYLRIQTTHTKFALYTVVESNQWTKEKLLSLTQKNKELIAKFPNRSLSNGGILWIH